MEDDRDTATTSPAETPASGVQPGGESTRGSRLRGRQKRFDHLLSRLSNEGAVNVMEIAQELQVSAASIRRDLGLLEGQRLLIRTHGGAVAQGVSYELPLRYRAGRREQEKREIAAEAALRVPTQRATVGLTGGTTTTEVARCLLDHPELTVVTNALNIASELVVRPHIRLVVTGGVARTQSYELCGSIAEAALAGLNLDVAFIGVDGISARAGLTTHQEVEAHTNQVMLSRAQRVIVVADSTKLGQVAFARICGISDIDEVITDRDADPGEVAALEEAGVQVTVTERRD
jgi:DeoR family transcriptional regulator of aga operon